jgi:hypothetical protein
MAGYSPSFGVSNVVNSRNGVVLGREMSQSVVMESVRFRNVVKEVALPVLFWSNNRSRERNHRLVVTANASQPRGESRSDVAAVTIAKEGGGSTSDSVVGKGIGVLEGGYEAIEDIGGSGGNGRFTNGRGGGGGGGGGDDNGDDKEEEELGPILKFAEVMKETEARGASLPRDMLEAAKSVGIRRVLLLRYLDLQVQLTYILCVCLNLLF